MGNIAKLKSAATSATSAQDDFRHQLAAAITAAATARETVEKHKVAIANLKHEAGAASRSIEAAKEAVHQAKEADASVLAAQAAKGLPSHRRQGGSESPGCGDGSRGQARQPDRRIPAA